MRDGSIVKATEYVNDSGGRTTNAVPNQPRSCTCPKHGPSTQPESCPNWRKDQQTNRWNCQPRWPWVACENCIGGVSISELGKDNSGDSPEGSCPTFDSGRNTRAMVIMEQYRIEIYHHIRVNLAVLVGIKLGANENPSGILFQGSFDLKRDQSSAVNLRKVTYRCNDDEESRNRNWITEGHGKKDAKMVRPIIETCAADGSNGSMREMRHISL